MTNLSACSPTDLELVFVCHRGPLEQKAALLAASLRANGYPKHRLIAAVPEPTEVWGRLEESTAQLFEQLEVETVPIHNPLGAHHPIGNKLACLDLCPPTAARRVFVDSDQLCLHPLPVLTARSSLALKPADRDTSGLDETGWRSVYQHLEVPVPRVKIAASISHEVMFPYFNTGMILFDPALPLGEVWREFSAELEGTSFVPDPFYLDQVSLPIAIASLGLQVDCVGQMYNFPLHHQRLSGSPYFVHYHWAKTLYREPRLAQEIERLMDLFPILRVVIESDEDWEGLVRKKLIGVTQTSSNESSKEAHQTGAAHFSDLPELLITGIPRSGTSLLCSLLGRLQDVVAINEPSEVFNALTNVASLHSMALYYSELRARILRGEPVENKRAGGRVVEDTKFHDQRSAEVEPVSRMDFLLATKNTLAYLARLDQMLKAIPRLSVFACIRHPADTVASWQHSFPHLRDVDLDDLPFARGNPWWNDMQQADLEQVDVADPFVRRALLWRFLARRIIENQDRLTILRYEDWVPAAEQTLRTILHQVAPGIPFAPDEPIGTYIPRQRRHTLSPEEAAIVNGLCYQEAETLGYALG